MNHLPFGAGGALACLGFAGVGYNRLLPRENIVLGLLRGGLAVVALILGVLLACDAAFAQSASAVISSAVDATTVTVPATSDTIVTIPAGNWANTVLDLFGAILMASIASLVAIACRFLPGWLQPLVTTAVQTAITNFARQGLAYAIQWVVGFDKDKTIDLNVGSAAVAVALRYVIEHAPAFLVSLAGGPDKIKEKLIALLGEFGITLDAQTSPAAVVAAANDDHPALLAVANG